MKRLWPLLAALLCGAAIAQTTVTIPVPAVSPAPITFTGSDGETFTVSPKPVTPPPVKYTPAPPPPVVVPAPAVIGTLAPAGSAASLTSALGAWTVPGGVVNLNGAPFGYSSGVVLLAYNGTAVYQESAACLWWIAGGTAAAPTWTSSGAPTGVPLPPCTPPTTVVTPPPVTTPPAGPQTVIFSYPNGFASAAPVIACHWAGGIVGGNLVPAIPPATGHAAGNCGSQNTFDVSGGFKVDFYFKTTAVTGSVTSPQIACLGVVIQNELATDHPNDGTWNNGTAYGNQAYGVGASGDANGCGFSAYNYPTQYAILHAAAVKLDMGPANGQWVTNAFPSVPKAVAGTGLYLNGGPNGALLPGLDMAGSGINLYLPDLFHAALSYDETNLALVLTDTVTGATFQTSWPVNIQQVVGGKNAFLTFTVGDGPNVNTLFNITAATLTTGMPTMPAAPAVPTATTVSGLTAGSVITNGSASLANGTLTLTDNQSLVPATATNEAGSAWASSPLPYATFHTSFTFKYGAGQGGGFAFCLHNYPTATPAGNFQWVASGPNVVGNSKGYGFGGTTNPSGGQLSWISNSACVKVDGNANTTGFYTAGQDPSLGSLTITGVNVKAGNPITMTLAYTGSALTLGLTDTVTKATYTNTWSGVNLAQTVGGTTAWVGLTGGAYAANQTVTGWTYGP